MRPLPARQVIGALTAKGFVLDERPGRDHYMYFLHVEGKRSGFFFKISRGANELRKDEISNGARQVGVPPSELFKILSCEYDSIATRALYDARSRNRA